MKLIWLTIALLMSLSSQLAHADLNYPFVRIACVPENGLLDVEYRMLHDSVTGAHAPPHSREALAKAGFHRPDGLKVSCQLGGVEYIIVAEQGQTSNFQCGGSPELYLNVTRNAERIFQDVVFGYSCNRLPSISRFTFGDGATLAPERIAQICYVAGEDSEIQSCTWTSGSPAAFSKLFPLDQAGVKRLSSKLKR